jgi:hypothetical protein
MRDILTPLYSSTGLRERVNELKENLKNKTRSFVYSENGDIGPAQRMVSGLFGCGCMYSASKLYTYTPIHLPSAILRAVMLPALVYCGLEFLGTAITGRFKPIGRYVVRRWRSE